MPEAILVPKQAAPQVTLVPKKHPLSEAAGQQGGLIADPLRNFGEGFTRTLAMGISVPFDLVPNILQAVGAQEYEDEDAFYHGTLDILRKTGFIRSDEQFRKAEGFFTNLGRDALPGLFGMGLMGAGARMGVQEGTAGSSWLLRKGKELFSEVGEQFANRPGSIAATETGASFGATEGQRMTEGTPYEPLGQMAGAVLGGAALSRIPYTSTGKAVARSTVPNEPVLPSTADPSVVPLLARDTVEAAKKSINDKITQAVQSVLPRGLKGRFLDPRATWLEGPRIAARQFRQEVRRSLALARVREDALWDGVNLKRPIVTTNLKARAERLIAENVDASGQQVVPNALPTAILKRIRDLPDTASLGDLIGRTGIRSEALKMLRKGAEGTMGHNLNEVQDMILDVISEAYPKDAPMALAREFSTWVNDRFFRGPLNDFLINDLKRDATTSMEALIRREIGGEEVAAVGQGLDRSALQEKAATYMRNFFRSHADEMGPEKAHKWLTSAEVQRFIQEFPKQSADLEITASKLSNAFAERTALERAAFTSVAKSDISTAVSGVFARGDKAQAAREIMDGLRGNKAAENGFRSAMIRNLFQRAGADPAQLQIMLNERATREMLSEVLDFSQFNRFLRIVSNAARVQAGETSKVKGLIYRPISVLARVLGAGAGRKFLNTGTIQAPGITSDLFRRSVDRFFIPLDPEELMVRAVIDPRAEKALNAAIPKNRKEAAKFLRAVQLYLSAEIGLMHNARSEVKQSGGGGQ